MSFNKVHKPTVAAMAALGAAALPGLAMAQAADNPLVLSFEGAVGTGNQANAYADAKFGNAGELDDDVAFVGSVGLSRAINENWDWSLSVSKLGYSDNAINDGDQDVGASLVNRAARSEAAFTFGRNVALGSANARLGLGLAYANASGDKGLDFQDIGGGGIGYFRSDVGTEFQGVGPRVTLDVKSAPVALEDKLSLIGGVEVNLLAGQYQHSKGFEAYDGDGSDFAADSQTTADGDMMTAGLKLGVEYAANESTVFRAGVRHDITRMDRAALTLTGPFDAEAVSVEDQRTSVFVGMDVGF